MAGRFPHHQISVSLPTPPRTTHKRKRVNDVEGGSFTSDEEDENSTRARAKRVRDAESEESFWLQGPSKSNSLLLFTRKQEPFTKQLESPPHTPTTKSHFASPPTTPPSKPAPNLTFRDSPDNPFLATPIGPDDEVIVTSESVLREEKPTMTYVFRGIRRDFPNPHYGVPPNPNSQLPPEHPDFEPDEAAVPKLLFGVKSRQTARSAQQ
ncbi:hypothetical protein MIND_01055600 [Mycena indigotica]|uniref:Uncharacterized protein n=1 Tax=Mycena indigotica TaxID=2126181 RepID=A0A8H6S987_9AGAR|nr:uncharacterized protein MIND_01055600 [Mycena indigotica]KAF7295168.1 hypothetical protein MIND_01055600 [Mycena indigotica]